MRRPSSSPRPIDRRDRHHGRARARAGRPRRGRGAHHARRRLARSSRTRRTASCRSRATWSRSSQATQPSSADLLILLPPSETKRSGGGVAALRLESLALRALDCGSARRCSTLSRALGRCRGRAARVLEARRDPARRGRRQRARADRADDGRRRPLHRRALRRAGCGIPRRAPPGAGWARTSSSTRRRSARWVHSTDPRVPARRGVVAARRRTAAAAVVRCRRRGPGGSCRRAFVLDLRSEAYVALGPVPASVTSVYVRVVTRQRRDGAVRALNHFNKHAKGALVRARRTSVRASASRAGLHAVGGCRRVCGCATARPASSSCSPEPRSAVARPCPGVLGGALGVLRDRDQGDDGLDDEPQDRRSRGTWRAARG